MTPHEIITRAVTAIPNIRLPLVRLTVDRIIRDLDDEGYKIKEKTLDDVILPNR